MPSILNVRLIYTINPPTVSQSAKDPVTFAMTVLHTSALDAVNGAQDILPPTVLPPRRPKRHGKGVRNGQGQQRTGG